MQTIAMIIGIAWTVILLGLAGYALAEYIHLKNKPPRT